MTLAGDLRDCLSDLLGSGVPEGPHHSDEPFRFFRQWLAERNLGLVPIADPSRISATDSNAVVSAARQVHFLSKSCAIIPCPERGPFVALGSAIGITCGYAI